jgi:hypothetical protein
MMLGEHTALVEEVIDFAFSGRVLFAVGPAEDTESAWITNDLRIALEANAGDGEISRFRMTPEQDVSGWGNSGLLGHNMATGDKLFIEDVAEELWWHWHDLTENLVAQFIKTSAYWNRPDRKTLHRLLFKRFISSSLEKDLRRRLVAILPTIEPLAGWKNCAEHLANNMTSELWFCAENRAFNGMTDNFWERMFRLYQQGVWPCGWRGFYPSPGRFVAYRRSADSAAEADRPATGG